MDSAKSAPAAERKLSLVSVQCRICYDNDKDEALIAPCHCKVSGFVWGPLKAEMVVF